MWNTHSCVSPLEKTESVIENTLGNVKIMYIDFRNRKITNTRQKKYDKQN